MMIYLDESGDLGFRPDGSVAGSNHFVVTFAASSDAKYIKRAVQRTKKKHKLPRDYEFKGSKTPEPIKKDLLRNLARAEIEVYTIIMNKSNVLSRLQRDTNILYNYVLVLVLSPYVTRQHDVYITIDKRITKVLSGVKLDEYLKYKVLYENRADVTIGMRHEDSKLSLGIQAVDVVSNSIFRKYETGEEKYYNLIRGRIREERRLFFE